MKKILGILLIASLSLFVGATVQHSELTNAELHVPFQSGTDTAATYDATPDVGDVYLETDTGILSFCLTDNVWTSFHRSLYDADNDTKIQVEESADEDIIRFDTGGSERAVIRSVGMAVGNQIAIYASGLDTGYCPDATTTSDSNIQRFYSNGSVSGQIDAAGIVTFPLQPCAIVTNAGDQSNIATGGEVTVVFDSEVADKNADFAANTFTAPVTGKYLISVQIKMQQLDQAASYYYIQIETSNRDYTMYLDSNLSLSGDTANYPFNFSVIADMDAADTAVIKYYQNGGAQQTDISSGSFFMVTLLN